MYIIHHIVIIAAPYYMVTQRDRFQLLPKSYYWLGWVRTDTPCAVKKQGHPSASIPDAKWTWAPYCGVGRCSSSSSCS